MPSSEYYDNITEVVRLSSDEEVNCRHCDFRTELDTLDISINHYIKSHGYKILHIGQETHTDNKGRIWHLSVAFLGK